MGRAASDDASELSVANAAASSAAARADREGRALRWLRPRAKGSGPQERGPLPDPYEKDGSKETGAAKGSRKLLPGLSRFHRRGGLCGRRARKVDLVRLEVKLLRSKDQKIVAARSGLPTRAALWQARARGRRRPPQIIVDMPGRKGTHHEHTEHSTKPVGKVDANGLSRPRAEDPGRRGFPRDLPQRLAQHASGIEG